jgi:hypothetical protein
MTFSSCDVCGSGTPYYASLGVVAILMAVLIAWVRLRLGR